MSKESALAKATVVTPQAAPAPKSPGIVAAPVEPVTAPESTEVSTDPNVQALLKKEIRLVKEQEALKAERADWQRKVADAEKLLERDRLFDETKKTDTVAALKMLGFNDTEIFNAVAASAPSEKTPEEVARLAAQEEIKKENDRRAQLDKEADAKKNENVIKQFKGSITQTIDKNADKYEYCKFYGAEAEELIYETVAEVLKTDKKLISVNEAADLVEAHYEEAAKAMDGLKKRKPAEPAVEVAAKPTKETTLVPQVNPRPKTLTNQAVVRSTTGEKPESPTDKRTRLERALAMGVHPSTLR